VNPGRSETFDTRTEHLFRPPTGDATLPEAEGIFFRME